MTVYVVTSGEYSDYSIRAIFTTRERAEAFCDEYNVAVRGDYGSKAEIEVWEADQPREQLPPAWYVQIDTSGKVVYSEYSTSDTPNKPPHHNKTRDREVFTGCGITEEHARRSAEELRRQTLTAPYIPVAE